MIASPRALQSRRVGDPPWVLQAPPFDKLRRALATRGADAPATPKSDLSADERRRARSALDALCATRVGGEYWAAPAQLDGGRGFRLARPRDAAQAAAMLAAALGRGDGDAEVTVVICAPDVAWGRRLVGRTPVPGVRVLVGPVDPWSLLARATALDADGDDPWILLALAAGLPVRCARAGAMSGWGLTEDAPGIPAQGRRSLEALAHWSLIQGVRYRDPFDGGASTCEAALAIAADWRRHLERIRGVGCVTGMRWWKRREVAQLLGGGLGAVPARSGAREAVEVAQRRQGAVGVWASRETGKLVAAARSAAVPLWRIEDGFLRSAGLGSDLVPPGSITLDRRGAHWDARTPSDLEALLADTPFPPALLARAERLIDAIVAGGATKYGATRYRSAAVEAPRDRRVVLVPGQVADDLSVRIGGGGRRVDLAFLEDVRRAEPDAFILFKPHPDVVAGHRPGALPAAEALRFVDRIVEWANPAELLGRIDAVHTLTSLTGFEALLRGREVIVHGTPFYAGWGLTRDLHPPPRRGRVLTLPELVAGALLIYPLYRDPVSGLPCPAEVLLRRLTEPQPYASALVRARRLQGWTRARSNAPQNLRA